jgi:hypothetical protein
LEYSAYQIRIILFPIKFGLVDSIKTQIILAFKQPFTLLQRQVQAHHLLS